MRSPLSTDDLTAIRLLARDAIVAGEQANEARAVGSNREAKALEMDRQRAIAQIYRILGVAPP
jgi:hypothetical protein